MNKPSQICHTGELTTKKVSCLGTPLSIVGYIMIVISIVMFLISLLLMAAAVFGKAPTDADMNIKTSVKLEKANIPPAMIKKIIAHKPLSLRESGQLSREQRKVIFLTKAIEIPIKKLAPSLARGVLGIISVIFFIFSPIIGIIGLIFIRKKKVVKCTNCNTTSK